MVCKMKNSYAFLLVFILGCNATKNKGEGNADFETLPTEKEINFTYEAYAACSTYYYFAKDTVNPILARVLWVDNKGNDKEENYIEYESYVPATSFSIYDSLGRQLIEYYRIDDENDKGVLSKTFSYYNTSGNLFKSVEFSYKRRLKKGVEKGIASPGGCIITADDYEKYKSWDLEKIWNYLYDKQGKLIEKISPKNSSSQNRYLYKYDSTGRLMEERSLEDEYPVWTESYTYSYNGYEFTRTWFEKDGSRLKKWDKTLESVDTFRYKTDRNNNIISETVIEESGRVVSTDINSYDDKNRIIRHEIYDEKNKLLGFYIHKYQFTAKPAKRKFIVTRK